MRKASKHRFKEYTVYAENDIDSARHTATLRRSEWGTVVLWYCGTVVLWYCGVVLWCGIVVWYCGVVLWCGIVVLWCGTVVWYCGVVLWCGIVVLWYCGTVVLWCGIVVGYCGAHSTLNSSTITPRGKSVVEQGVARAQKRSRGGHLV